MLILANLKMENNFVAICELIHNEPMLKKGMLGLLLAIFIDALEVLRDNINQSDVKLALEFIDEDNDLFIALANELDIEPCLLKKKILRDIGVKKTN